MPVDLRAVLGSPRPLIGMVHLLPLPGSPRWGGSMQRILDRAVADARAIREGGLDAIIVENYGDVPFFPERVPPETIAAMALATAAVVQESGLPIGVNVLRNDADGALALCAAAGARFIRVNVHTGTMHTDQGTLLGGAHQTLRRRAALGLDVPILADVFVKHATPPPGTSITEAARDVWERGLADALIVSGSGTGEEVDADRLRAVRAAVPDAPLLIGSGLSPANGARLIPLADGSIIGSAIQEHGRAGNPVVAERIRLLLDAIGPG